MRGFGSDARNGKPGGWAALWLFVALTAGYLAARWSVLGHLGAGGRYLSGSFSTSVWTGLCIQADYLRRALWPLDVTTSDAFPIHHGPDWAVVSAVLLLLLAVALAAEAWRRRLPLAMLGAGWWAIHLLAVSNLVPLVHVRADRFLYLPLLGFCAAIAEGLDRLAMLCRLRWGRQVSRRAAGAIIGGLCLACGAWSWRLSGDWRDDVTLFTNTLRLHPECREARMILAQALLRRGKPEEATPQLEAALASDPSYASFFNLPVAYYLLGYSRFLSGKPAEAEAAYRRGLAMAELPDLRIHLGYLLLSQGRLEEAEQELSRGVALKPRYTDGQFFLGNALFKRGKFAEATVRYAEAVRLRPDYPEAHNNWGMALAKQGRMEEAASHFIQALRLKPDFAQARSNLALAGRSRVR